MGASPTIQRLITIPGGSARGRTVKIRRQDKITTCRYGRRSIFRLPPENSRWTITATISGHNERSIRIISALRIDTQALIRCLASFLLLCVKLSMSNYVLLTCAAHNQKIHRVFLSVSWPEFWDEPSNASHSPRGMYVNTTTGSVRQECLHCLRFVCTRTN